MSHYYTNDPNLNSQESEFSYTYFGKELKFKSDLGVFSKERVDFGTNVLINSLPDLSWAKSFIMIQMPLHVFLNIARGLLFILKIIKLYLTYTQSSMPQNDIELFLSN